MITAASRIKPYVSSDVVVKLLPLFAFAAPLVLLYFLNPADLWLKMGAQDTFQVLWKGRTFQLFFIWLIALEFILSWENFKPKVDKQNKAKFAATVIAMLLPTFYVVSEYYLGLNATIANFSLQNGVGIPNDMPIGFEYLAFSVLFFVIVLLFFGIKSLKSFALPGLFAGLVGFIYTIDSVFPYGAFTPFQILVPTTATLAAKTLNLMGYATVLTTQNGMPTLQATGALGTAKFSIAWPCAGIESFLIFAAVALLFLQQMQVSWKAKTGFFVFGVIVTYFINVLRITTIFTLGMQYGVNSTQVTDFHSYYGPLYSITWIVLYPIVILISLNFWQKRKMRKSASDENLRKPQPTQLSLA